MLENEDLGPALVVVCVAPTKFDLSKPEYDKPLISAYVCKYFAHLK